MINFQHIYNIVSTLNDINGIGFNMNNKNLNLYIGTVFALLGGLTVALAGPYLDYIYKVNPILHSIIFAVFVILAFSAIVLISKFG